MNIIFIRIKTILAIISLILIFFVLEVVAKNDEVPDVESLIKTAIENNPELKTLYLKYQSSISKISQEKSLEDTIISLNSMNMPTNLPAFGTSMMTALSLSISQKTVYSDKLLLKEKIALTMSQIEQQMFFEKVNFIKMNIKQSYYELSYLEKVIELQNRNKELLKELSKITQTKYITGSGTQQDIIKVNIEVSKLNKNLIDLNKKKERTIFEINKLIYKPIFSPLKASKELKLRKVELNFEKIKKISYQTPELKKAQMEINISEYELKLAELDTIPDFDFMLGYTVTPDRADLISAGISFNLPIWYKNKQQKMIEEKKLSYIASLSTIKNIENIKDFNLAVIINRIEENESKYEYLFTGILPQLKDDLKSSLINYQTGKSEFMSLLDTQREIIDNEMELQMTLLEHEKDISELEFEIGREIK